MEINQRFSIIPKELATDPTLTGSEAKVLLALGIHTDSDGFCYPSQKRIAEISGLSRKSVVTAISRLCDRGYLKKVGTLRDDGGRGSNKYWVRVAPDYTPPCEAEVTGVCEAEVTYPVKQGLQQERTHINEPIKNEDPPQTDLALTAYNRLAEQKNLPKAQRLTDTRKRKLSARLKDCGGIEGWVEALKKVAASEFLCGQNERKWKANLDFLLQESSFTKLMEGAYSTAKTEINWDKVRELMNDDTGRSGPGSGKNADAVPDPEPRRQPGGLPRGVRQIADALPVLGKPQSG